MERKLGHLVPYERRDTVAKVSVEPEKLYGIYLPDWNSVTQAINSFASSEYQSNAPLTKEETIFEYDSRIHGNRPKKKFKEYSKDDLLDFKQFYGDPPLQENIDFLLTRIHDHFERGGKTKLLDQHEGRGTVQIYQRKNQHSDFFLNGRTFHKTDLTLEALRSVRKENSDSPEDRRYTGPYLLNLYSSLNTENPEQILLRKMEGEQALLPRRVQVLLLPEGYTGLDTGELADRLNTTLQNEDKTKINKLTVSSGFTKPEGRSLGNYDGLELKMRSYYTQHLENASKRQEGVEFLIADPTLESRMYGVSNIIPPEKRQAARNLAEKLREAFSQ